ncbi:MAG: hypothetical protein JXB26_09530 [Candidatus Aminicenantes bacterium]|nr:hypothetical protein [Candidatus Aminicenantes bacterium]
MEKRKLQAAGIIFFLCLFLMRVPLHSQKAEEEAVYGDDGFFIGASFSFVSLEGDFDGNLILFNEKQAFITPRMEKGTGFGLNFGIKSRFGLWSFVYLRSTHKNMFQGKEGESVFRVVGLDAMPFLMTWGRLRPYLLIGINIPWIIVKDGWTYYDSSGGDASFVGIGVNAGGGLLFHLQPRLFIRGTAAYRYLGFLYVSGEKGRSRDVTDLYISEGNNKQDQYLAMQGWTFSISLGISI